MTDGGTSRARRGTLAGQHLAGHEFVRVLAAGGMGEVYLARHVGLDMLRAVKVIRSNLRELDDAQTRFTREAQVLARLSHNSIVQIIDFGTLPNGWPYLVMEYVDGPNLDQVVDASGPLPLAQALPVLEQIAAALHYAHKLNVVHRDLKPANVLLRAGDRRQVKVIDFGLAQSQRSDDKMRLTLEGQLLGSPLYMAPEQADGRLDTGAAVDVYALAALAYTLLSGKPPFHGTSLLQLIAAHADEVPPRLTERVPQLPRFLDDLFYACLAKDPAGRPHTDELAGHLARLARNTETAAVPPTSGSKPPASKPSRDDSISRLLDRPPPDTGSGVAPALINQVLAIVGELAINLSSLDGTLAKLVDEIATVRAELTDVEMELALIDAGLDAAAPASIHTEKVAAEARARTLNERVMVLVREMVGRVEVQRGRGDRLAEQLFGEVDQVLAQLATLARTPS